MKLFAGTRSLFTALILVSLVFGLQACSGGGGSSTPATPANANPIGYYAGTLTVASPAQANLTAKAIVDSDKFLIVHIDNSATQNTLLYKGTFTAITATTFTADVRIYRNGAFLRTATISNGTITEKSSMSGTLSGTGDYTATSFSLAYDTVVNARTPLVSVSADLWVEPFDLTAGNRSGILFSSSTQLSSALFGNAAIVLDNLKGCNVSNVNLTDISGEQTGRLKKYSMNYLGSSCTNTPPDFSMTSYMTTFDSGSNDNRYLWISYNDNNFFAGELVKQ